MISPSLNSLAQQFLNNLNRIADRMDQAQRRISTGVRLAQVSDDPDQVSNLLSARSSLSAAHQIQSNLGRVKAEVDAGEQSLQTAVQLLDRARTLGIQGATSGVDASVRSLLANEVGSVIEQIAGLAATQVEGRFIFSGDADSVTPYTVNLALTPPLNPISAYLGSAATRIVQHPNGTTFLAARSAQEIFDAATPSDNVFQALVVLRQALLDNDEPAIFNAVEALRQPAVYLNDQLAFYGTTQNRIAEADQFGQKLVVQLQGQIARIEDADLTEAILELNQSQTQQQAALSARAKVPRQTLFDYLG